MKILSGLFGPRIITTTPKGRLGGRDGMIEDSEMVDDELKEDMETLLSMAIEVKKNNTDEFMIYFKGRVNGLVSKYFGGD